MKDMRTMKRPMIACVAIALAMGSATIGHAQLAAIRKPHEGGSMQASGSAPQIEWGMPERAINGKLHENGWASDKSGAWLRIDLQETYELMRVDYHPIGKGSMQWVGGYELYVSERRGPEDELLTPEQAREHWGEPVAQGAWSDSTERQILEFTPVKGRYVVLYRPDEATGSSYTWSLVQEISIYDTGALERMMKNAQRLRDHYLADHWRPGYHFTVPEGVHLPVDPNACLFWNGRYHMFYIYQEPGMTPGLPIKLKDIHYWGHVSSVDLVNWRHHPPALSPGEGDAGIFSGGVFIDRNGVPTITYWGLGNPRGVCLATSTDPLLERWEKSPHNPVIRETGFGITTVKGPDGNEVTVGASDPSAIWWHNNRYNLLTGNLQVLESKGMQGGPTTFLWHSDDMLKWTYQGEFYQSRREWTAENEDNMCTEFFPLPSSPEGGKPTDTYMMLCISHNKGCRYYLGEYANDRFLPKLHERMTWGNQTWGGNAVFAPEILLDDKGRAIMWAWVFGWHEVNRGWSGSLSLPRVFWAGEDGTLRQRPVPELEVLRYNPRDKADLVVAANSELRLPEISGNSLELLIEVPAESVAHFSLNVLCAPDDTEQTVIQYQAAAGRLVINATKSGDGPRQGESAPLQLQPGEPLVLRVFLDKSFVEVFANDRQAAVVRVYPKPDSTGVVLVAGEAEVKVSRLQAWDMMESSPW